MIVGETRRIARGNRFAEAKLYVDFIVVPRNGPIPTILLLPRDASWESARRKIHNYRLTKVPTASQRPVQRRNDTERAEQHVAKTFPRGFT